MQNTSVTGQPGQIRNDDHIGLPRVDRRQKSQQAGASRVVGRFATVFKNSDKFDSVSLRNRPDRCELSVEPRPRM